VWDPKRDEVGGIHPWVNLEAKSLFYKKNFQDQEKEEGLWGETTFWVACGSLIPACLAGVWFQGLGREAERKGKVPAQVLEHAGGEVRELTLRQKRHKQKVLHKSGRRENQVKQNVCGGEGTEAEGGAPGGGGTTGEADGKKKSFWQSVLPRCCKGSHAKQQGFKKKNCVRGDADGCRARRNPPRLVFLKYFFEKRRNSGGQTRKVFCKGDRPWDWDSGSSGKNIW